MNKEQILWNATRLRTSEKKKVFGQRGRKGGTAAARNAAGNPYLFSGLLKCSECGANLILVSGKGKNRFTSLGMPGHRSSATEDSRTPPCLY